MRIVNIIARIVALLSFIVGVAIFLWYYETHDFSLVWAGIAFIYIAVAANLFILVVLVAKLFSRQYRRMALISIGLVLANVPVAIFLGYHTYTSTDVARQTLVNGTKSRITDITISGCGDVTHIREMSPGQRVRIRYKLDKPCDVTIRFSLNGQVLEHGVFGTDRPVELASWNTFIIEKDIVYSTMEDYQNY